MSRHAINFILLMLGILPLRINRALAHLIAFFLCRTNNAVRRVTEINIRAIQPDLEAKHQQRIINQSIHSTLLNSLEMLYIWHSSNQRLRKKIESIDNEEVIHAAIANGSGVILLSPHVGNWELTGRMMAEYGEITSLYQPPKQQALEDIVKLGREKSGALLVPTNQRGIAQLLKTLRAGKMIGILPDQVPKQSGVYAPFFGVPAYTMTLIHSFIQKTNCKVVLVYGLRTKKGFRIIFKEPPQNLYAQDQQLSVTALSRLVEMSTEEDLSQYQWAYKRFKKQPDGSHFY